MRFLEDIKTTDVHLWISHTKFKRSDHKDGNLPVYMRYSQNDGP